MAIDLLKKILIYFGVMTCFLIILLGYDHSHWNGIDEENDETIIKKLINRFYFLTSTFSTAGYGDITPKTNSCRVIIIILQLFVIIGIFEILQSATINK
jgi:hypothetical protein